MPSFARYVALGDSTTEGLDDPRPGGGWRGWADRLAERLAAPDPEAFGYANLAIRGRLAGQVRAEQLDAALALRPDLASVVAGLNDLLRPRGTALRAAAEVEAMQAALRRSGATVLSITLPDLSGFMPIARLVRGKLAAYNDALRAASARTGAVLLDLETVPVAADPRLWSADRLHANAEGHARIAAAAAQALGLPGADGVWAEPLAPVAPRRRAAALATELDWSRHHLAPWIARRATGRSSGDGVVAKRPELGPLGGPG